MSFWDGKKVLVAGGAGFIGSHLVEELLERGRGVQVTVADQFSKRRQENLARVEGKVKLVDADFRSLESCLAACRGQEIVLNLAARVGGIEYNRTHQGTMFRDNMLIACQLTEASRLSGVERMLVVSSACVYPRSSTIPTPESEGFLDSPEPTNAGYGWAKRMAEVLAQGYREEFGLRTAIVRPYNAYGPRDRFDEADSHVIAALIRRVFSGENPMTVWGDGAQSRAFLYVTDAARGMLEVCEKRAETDPINIGTDDEVTIKTLAETIVRLSGLKVDLRFDPSKPAGQKRRNCDTTKAQALVGFKAQVGLEEGLRRTIEWYKRTKGTGV